MSRLNPYSNGKNLEKDIKIKQKQEKFLNEIYHLDK